MDPNDILGSLMDQLGSGGVERIGRAVGVSGGDVTNVLAGAIPAMMAGLTRNAASSGGADALLLNNGRGVFTAAEADIDAEAGATTAVGAGDLDAAESAFRTVIEQGGGAVVQ